MKVRAAGFEPAICASAPATVTYRTLGYGSALSDPRTLRAIPGMSAISTTLAMLIITGCATSPTVPTVTLVPVAQSCIKDAPALPATTDEKALLGMDDYAATLTTWTERLLLKAYALKADAIIAACR